ncbi:major facilitator transporter [Lampropedia cohaerens]|uniref:Bcr/CflA family efflux transporter n=1 Tax=Lampropedia cohaerens TaxID=1610491 RepID=A0A0U1PX92_9BURK|nr:multidrug effflux MFS transporter [Lampropedia cohaerens]KKW67139.1 major facilitator transporter [Lampropedia cohaerens]
MSLSFVRMALLLGLLSAIGPFAIDMYLPALPLIGQALRTDMATVQLSLTVFFISVGFGQLLYGPLSDRFGRRLPLSLGLALFAAASIGCALAGSATQLLLFRFLQGLGAAASMSIPRAVVRDLHTGHEAARLMSLLMLVFSVCPILAPLAGSFLIDMLGWRAVFWFITLLALAGIAATVYWLPETWGAERRSPVDGQALDRAWQAYRTLLKDGRFVGLVVTGGCAMACFFTYLVSSSFVMMGHFGLTPRQYALAFALNAISFFGMAQFNGTLGRRFGLANLVRVAALAGFLVLLTSTLVHWRLQEHIALLIGTYLLSGACFALVVPNTVVLAMDAHGPIAGAASALMGTLQMLIGAAAMALASQFTDGTPLRMVLATVLCAACALVATALTLGLRWRA